MAAAQAPRLRTDAHNPQVRARAEPPGAPSNFMKMLPVIFLLGAFLLGAFLLGAKLGDFYGIQLGRNWGVFYWELFYWELFCSQ